ncbi:MAG: hypothetical protein LBU24_05740 [Methanocalculaceae archaeon]|jgi:hypothetical protein|nr:hypothetical protein [Methanocalculaceae archaeon]
MIAVVFFLLTPHSGTRPWSDHPSPCPLIALATTLLITLSMNAAPALKQDMGSSLTGLGRFAFRTLGTTIYNLIFI